MVYLCIYKSFDMQSLGNANLTGNVTLIIAPVTANGTALCMTI